MSQQRMTIYTCDRCGNAVERKRDMVRFNVQRNVPWESVHFDACAACEAELLKFVAAYLPEDQSADVLARAVK